MDTKDYHFIGIGGIGMSALATILMQRGHRVRGSDTKPSFITAQLEKRGAQIFTPQDAANVKPSSTVVYSTDITDRNVELAQAKKLGLPLFHRADFLSELMKESAPLLVTGTHGKTTTSSLLAHLLVDAGLRPSYAIGGLVHSLSSNGGHGEGDYFVAEADESDGSFLKYTPFGSIITNIDNDHLAHWKSLNDLILGFEMFAQSNRSADHLFWCGDDRHLVSLKLKGSSYGFDEHNDLHIKNYRQDAWKLVFDFSFDGKDYFDVEIPLIGGHNVLNASAVFGLGLRVNIPEDKIRKAFLSFHGVARRAELKGEINQISIYDDYGHHPTEIFATTRAMKQAILERRLVVAFQPHRYSRTQDCMAEFGPAFVHADIFILTDIYAAGESAIPDVTEDVLMKKIRESGIDVHYVPRSDLSSYLSKFLKKGDVLLTMGAGDITHIGPEVLKKLQP